MNLVIETSIQGYLDGTPESILRKPFSSTLQQSIEGNINNGQSDIAGQLYAEILHGVHTDGQGVPCMCGQVEVHTDDTDVRQMVQKILLEHSGDNARAFSSYGSGVLQRFVEQLPDSVDLHISYREHGCPVKLVYHNGQLVSAVSYIGNLLYGDVTEQMKVILGETQVFKQAIEDRGIVEVCGYVVLPTDNLPLVQGCCEGAEQSAESILNLLHDDTGKEVLVFLEFIAHRAISDDLYFRTVERGCEYLEDMGFRTPTAWTISDLQRETLVEDLPDIIQDCLSAVEEESQGYSYTTQGLMIQPNDLQGQQNPCVLYNADYHESGIYTGVIQAIRWSQGKSRLTPYAVLAETEGKIQYADDTEPSCIYSETEVSNWKELGVSADGAVVREVPLYDANMIAMLSAFPGETLYFRYTKELGAIPCMENGDILSAEHVRHVLTK